MSAPSASPSSLALREPYHPRPVRPLGLWSLGDWRIKAYGITYGGAGSPHPSLVDAARRLAVSTLPTPALTPSRYGVGYVGIHQGRGADFVFVDWWAEENELHHHVFSGPGGAPDRLAECTATGPSACVWDLSIIGFERQAWLDCVLANPAGPDLDAYLARRMRADV